jgi:septal ring-binding cell division protein DamX
MKDTSMNYKNLRTKTGLNQSEFWAAVGVTQSGGSRIEAKNSADTQTNVLLHLIYVQPEKACAAIEVKDLVKKYHSAAPEAPVAKAKPVVKAKPAAKPAVKAKAKPAADKRARA